MDHIGLLTQKQIAELSGCTQSHISKIINGDRIPTVRMALDLESATGICREAWLYPERHWNPYIPFNGLTSCLSCQNRSFRSQKAMEMCIADFKDNKDFTRICQIGIIYIGQKGILMTWRELISESESGIQGLRLLGYFIQGESHFPIPEMYTKEETPYMYQLVEREESTAIEHFPYDIPKVFEQEVSRLFDSELKSMLTISRHGLNFFIGSFFRNMLFTDELVSKTEEYVEEIATLYTSFLHDFCLR